MSSPVVHLPALAAEALGALVDDIAAISRMEASLAAMKAELLEQTRRLNLELSMTPGDSSAWSAAEAARRILVTEIACALSMPERSAESLLSDSDALVNHLPATLDSLAHGRISWRHAHVIADHAMSLPTESRGAFEMAVVSYAESHTATRLNRQARIVRERMHPQSVDERHLTAVATRTVEVQPSRDGMAWLSALLPAVTAHAIFDRLDRAAMSARAGGDGRTHAQLRADAFAAGLLGAAVSHAGPADSAPSSADFTPGSTDPVPGLASLLAAIRPQVQITVPVLTLLGHGDEPATLDGHGPIDRETTRLLAAEAPSLIRLLTHPETGAVLSVGRDRYTIPADLRRWLRTRDGTCRFPGCGRSAKRSDIDHTNDWQHGGGTRHDNLAHLCRSHHRLKHLTEWRVEHAGDGVLRWISPLGRNYVTEPEEGQLRAEGKLNAHGELLTRAS